MHFVRNMTGADVCRRLLYETGGISDELIPAKKPYWFDVKASAAACGCKRKRFLLGPRPTHSNLSFTPDPQTV